MHLIRIGVRRAHHVMRGGKPVAQRPLNPPPARPAKAAYAILHRRSSALATLFPVSMLTLSCARSLYRVRLLLRNHADKILPHHDFHNARNVSALNSRPHWRLSRPHRADEPRARATFLVHARCAQIRTARSSARFCPAMEPVCPGRSTARAIRRLAAALTGMLNRLLPMSSSYVTCCPFLLVITPSGHCECIRRLPQFACSHLNKRFASGRRGLGQTG